MNSNFHKSHGTLHYSPLPSLRLVVDVDPAISEYYRSLIPKYIQTNKQMYDPHISVVRKEHVPNLSIWGKYEGEKIEFIYDGIVHFGRVYCWLDVFSLRLEEIRSELGVKCQCPYPEDIPKIPEGFKWIFHISIGNFKSKNT